MGGRGRIDDSRFGGGRTENKSLEEEEGFDEEEEIENKEGEGEDEMGVEEERKAKVLQAGDGRDGASLPSLPASRFRFFSFFSDSGCGIDEGRRGLEGGVGMECCDRSFAVEGIEAAGRESGGGDEDWSSFTSSSSSSDPYCSRVDNDMATD
jgi:hypothetical protein